MSTMHDLWRRVTGRRGAVAGHARGHGADPRARGAHGDQVEVEAVEVDPLVTLDVQLRLAFAAAEVRRIEADAALYARAHHWRAAVLAYDSLLREACYLAGVDPQDVAEPPAPLDADAPRAQEARLREELELTARGWSW
jgi:anti-sigma-K factor RskA